MKRIISRNSVGVVAVCGALLATSAYGAALPSTIYVASPQAGALQHTVASAIAKVVSDAIESKMVVRPYSGTTAFFPIVNSGEVAFGVAPSVDFGLSYRGPEKLKIGGRNPYPQTRDLRLVASGSSLIAGVLVPKDSDIKSVRDLKGQTMAGQYPAHLGAYINTYAHLLNAGLGSNDVKIVPVASLRQGIDALVAGRVDAATAGVGAPYVREADAAIGVRFIPDDCSPAAVKRITDAIPGYGTITLPAGRLPGIVADTCLTAYPIYLVASTNTPDNVVAAVTKALYENAGSLGKYHPTLKGWKAAGSVTADATLPYHEAAIETYKALGAWTEDAAARRKELLE